VRNYGKARICYNAMGHGVEAFEHPINQLLLQRGALWVLNQSWCVVATVA
jgi:type 1 glutamine amidotransferase